MRRRVDPSIWPKPWEHPAVAGKHVINMTREYPGGAPLSVATCQCGWCSKIEVAPSCHDEQDLAVLHHWQSVIDDDIAARRRKRRAA